MNRGEAATPICVFVISEFPLIALGLEQLVGGARPAMRLGGAVTAIAEARALLLHIDPDVVIVDIDGDTGVESVRALKDCARGRVLALTAKRGAELQDEAVLAGANGLVRKTEPLAVLLKAVERIHDGEIWVDRMAAGRIFLELARQRKAEPVQDPQAERVALLTRKERLTVTEVVRDASATPRQIAERLHISENTLRNHLTSIYAKLGLTNRRELHAYVLSYGLLGA